MTFMRNGLTLIEVMVAILVFAVGALGLTATSAAVVRQMVSSEQRTRAAHMASTTKEKLNASPCSSSSSSESLWGMTSSWTTNANASSVALEQTLQRRDSKGLHVDRFLSSAPCD
ncbi:MAG: prepilin-type N-terminal cleavage/methylation domain-containing protein [Gemmatimonadaceae bacterium]